MGEGQGRGGGELGLRPRNYMPHLQQLGYDCLPCLRESGKVELWARDFFKPQPWVVLQPHCRGSPELSSIPSSMEKYSGVWLRYKKTVERGKILD